MTIICPPPLCARPEHPDLYVSDQWDYEPLSKPTPITEQRWPEGTRPLVSIRCTTFNQEKYIRQAIEGFLMQETTFPVQIFIHDDASTDKTAAIVREYEALYPDLFLVVMQPANLFSQGIRRQIDHLLCGKYIAYCEGDDYWTHPWKLQVQCSYLMQNPDTSLVYHPVLVLDVHNIPQVDHTKPPANDNHREYFLQCGNFIHTPSVVVVHHGIPRPPEADASPAGDFFAWLLALGVGRMHMIPNCMAVYRWGSGIWSSIPETPRVIKTNTIFFAAMDYCFRIGLECESKILGDRIFDSCNVMHASINEDQLQSWSMIGPASSSLVRDRLRPAINLKRSEVALAMKRVRYKMLIRRVLGIQHRQIAP